MNRLRGFTLVEIMISVLILGVGLTSVANSYILALRGAAFVENNITALIIAKEKFENLEFASLKGAIPFSSPAEIIKSSSRDYNYQQEITLITESVDLAEHLVSACLTVSWREKNSLKNVTLTSFLLKQKETILPPGL
ncbi:MAG: prepilin-type N-terminal cleavage/methylation domain-containing protein [Candidatus Omnitrophota bacterium]